MESSQWFYLKKGQQRGPVDTSDLASLINSGVLPPDTLVFTSTQADWIPANATGVFPLKTATLTAGNDTFKQRAIAAVVLLFLMLGGGLLVMLQKQSEGKPMNDHVRGKYQFDAAQPSPRKEAAEQNNSGNLQSNRPVGFGNRQPFADTGSLQSQLVEVNISRLQLEQNLEDSRQQNADLNQQIKIMGNQSQFGNITNDDLAASREIRLQLEQRLTAASRLNANLLQRVKQMEANDQQDSLNNVGLTAQLRKASEELETAQQKISSLQKRLKEANPPATNTPIRNRPQRIPMVPTNAVGNITYVNTLSKFIGINRGSDNGVKYGDVFRIISRSTGGFLGRITITKTGPSFAGGHSGRSRARPASCGRFALPLIPRLRGPGSQS